MQDSSNFKHDFLKYLLLGLHESRDSSRGLNLNERKREIKHLADASMALARGSGANWSRALTRNSSPASSFLKSKTIVKKCFISRLKARKKKELHSRRVSPRITARRLVRKRTKVLKRIIPGAESLHGISLLSETLDYVIYLRAQAIIMRQLTTIFGVSVH